MYGISPWMNSIGTDLLAVHSIYMHAHVGKLYIPAYCMGVFLSPKSLYLIMRSATQHDEEILVEKKRTTMKAASAQVAEIEKEERQRRAEVY